MINYQYLRLNIKDYLLKSGTAGMTGNLDMCNNRITNLANPLENSHATNKTYVDTSLNDLKNYVDISFVNIAGTQNITGTKTFTTTISGSILGNAGTATTLKTQRTLWGQTFNGSADVSGNLSNVGTIKGGTSGITIDASGLNQSIILKPSGTGKLDMSGNALIRGTLDMSNNKITLLSAPTTGTDAVNKTYVDISFVNIAGTQNITGTKTFTTTISGSILGNAGTATTLQNAKTLWGQSFNGSANVSGDLSNVGTIKGGTSGITIDASGINQSIILKPSGTTGIVDMSGNAIIRGTIYTIGDASFNIVRAGSTTIVGTNTLTVGGTSTLTGNVGIGKASSINALDVSGNAIIRGNLDMSNNKITSLAAPTTGTDAVNKTYVDTSLNTLKIYIDTINATTATNATTAENATNVVTAIYSGTATVYPTFVSDTSGNNSINVSSNLTFNPSTNTLTTTTFSGDISGNATTATTLKTQRTLWGQSFNGSANVSGDLSNVGTIKGGTSGITIDASGTNQNIILKPSGTTGIVDMSGNAIIRGGITTIGDASFNIVRAGSTTIVGTNTLTVGGTSTLTGNVGIGKASSTSALDVSGNAIIRGNLDMSNNKITLLAAPTTGTDAVNKTYVDTSLNTLKSYIDNSNNFVNIAGTQNITGTKTFTTTISGSISGNAGTATILQNSKTLWGQSFNGLANVSGDLSNVGTIKGGTSGITIDASGINQSIILKPSGTTGIVDMSGNAIIRGRLDIARTPDSNWKLYVDDTGAIQGALGIKGNAAITAKLAVGSGTIPTETFKVTGSAAITGTSTLTGNVGIGKASSTSALDVSGNAIITGNLDVSGGVLTLNGGSAVDTNVDTSNNINTFIKFGEAGATSDWAYLRQIGTSNDYHMAVDFHDNLNDGKFSLRSINSFPENPDAINTFFYSSPTGTIINSELNMSNKKITSLAPPTAGTDAVNKTYVDASLNTLKNYVDTSLNVLRAYVNQMDISFSTIKTGDFSGNATNATNVVTAIYSGTATTVYPTFVATSSGNNSIKVDANLTFDPSTNTLTTTTFAGDLSGNAGTATTLKTQRTLWGQTFNGSADVSGNLSNVGTIKGGTSGITIDASGLNQSIILKPSGTGKLDMSGNALIRGNLDMSNNKITLLAAPTTGTDATNKTYVDTSLNTLKNYVDTSLNVLRAYVNSLNIYVDASGDAVIGTNLDMSDNTITLLTQPTTGTDAVNKDYVDSSLNTLKNYVDISFVNIAGTQNITGTKTFTTTISGSISGNAATATFATDAETALNATNVVTNNSTSASPFYPTFVSNATGNNPINVDVSLTFIPSTNTLTTTTFAGDLSGNAGTATTLKTQRTLWGQSFNGSANVSGDLSNVGTIKGGTSGITIDASGTNQNIILKPSGTGKLDMSGNTIIRGSLDINYANPSLNIRATNETENSTLYLSTPYSTYPNTKKTAIIAKGITNNSKADLLFCLNSATDNITQVSDTDAKMTILNTGNVGIGINDPKARLDVNGNTIIRGILDMSNNKITLLAAPTTGTDATNKTYVDTSLNTLKTYVDNFKLNKAGDTMTGILKLNGNGSGGSEIDSGVIPTEKINTYIRFGEAGATGDWAYLRQIGGSSGTSGDIHLSFDFHDDTNDGKFSLRSINSASNDKINTFFYSSPTGTTINSYLDMSNNKITNVLDPTSAQDGATKNYVDALVGNGAVGAVGAVKSFINQSTSEKTIIKKTLNYSQTGTTLLKTSDVNATLDSWSNDEQVYTFGQSIPNRWVAVGFGTTHTIAYSSDGINWTGLGTSIFSDRGFDVAWNGTRWVAVGQGTNSIAYSSDGITWTGATNNTSIFSTNGYGVAWNGTRWVAVGSGTNTIAYSSDGITWTGLGKTIFSAYGNGVAWNGTRWVAVGYGTTNSIAYSSDGITWTEAGTSIFSGEGYGVAWNGRRWVAVGQGTNSIAYSSDGITWTGAGTSIFSDYGQGVASNPNIGAVIVDSQITLNDTSVGLSSNLDVVSDTYFNGGFTNFSASFTTR